MITISGHSRQECPTAGKRPGWPPPTTRQRKTHHAVRIQARRPAYFSFSPWPAAFPQSPRTGPNGAARTATPRRPASTPGHLAENAHQEMASKVGDGVATPALVDGKLYVFTRRTKKKSFAASTQSTGNEIWQQAYESEAARGAAGSFPGREARRPWPRERSSRLVCAEFSPVAMRQPANSFGRRKISPNRGRSFLRPAPRSSSTVCALPNLAAQKTAASSPTTWRPATKNGAGWSPAQPTPRRCS